MKVYNSSILVAKKVSKFFNLCSEIFCVINTFSQKVIEIMNTRNEKLLGFQSFKRIQLYQFASETRKQCEIFVKRNVYEECSPNMKEIDADHQLEEEDAEEEET